MPRSGVCSNTCSFRLPSGSLIYGTPIPDPARQAGSTGATVRVHTGPFADFEGTILRRDNERRLLVTVRFMEQGASVVLDDCQVERID
ncbi:MAG: hypothetical protein GXY83_07070 [Rhodopirellula sp.]|nr:hypothetical protein [Rhodopirellula sp.]